MAHYKGGAYRLIASDPHDNVVNNTNTTSLVKRVFSSFRTHTLREADDLLKLRKQLTDDGPPIHQVSFRGYCPLKPITDNGVSGNDSGEMA